MGGCGSIVNSPGVCVNLGNDISYLDVNIVKISSHTMGGITLTFHPIFCNLRRASVFEKHFLHHLEADECLQFVIHSIVT